MTDILYTSVPIFYLSTVKLGANVQWGLRIVLLFGLMYVLPAASFEHDANDDQRDGLLGCEDRGCWKNVQYARRYMYDPAKHIDESLLTGLPGDAVDLSIWSTAEVNVCIVAACLPPLRSQFDSFLRRFFGLAFSRSTTRSRQTYGSHSIALQTQSKSHRTVIEVEAQDFGSERSILPPDDVEGGIIRKTRQVQVKYEEHEQDTPYSPNPSYDGRQ